MDYPAFILTLLSGNWLFFKDDEIVWDGKHHAIAGLQVNAAQSSRFMDFVDSSIDGFEDINEVAQYFVAFLNEVEKDEGLKAPRSAIAPGVRKALPEGDLTGLTLANLAACGAALSVRNTGDDEYAVMFDSRLAMAIPCFFSLVARLLWDLRGCTVSQSEKPFSVTFLGARNIDADQYFGSVSKPVSGAQENPVAMSVSSIPEVSLAKAAAPQKRQRSKSPLKKTAASDEPSSKASSKKAGCESKTAKSKDGAEPKETHDDKKSPKSKDEALADKEKRMRRAEKAALAAHGRVEKQFASGRAWAKKPQFDGRAKERILHHLLETGGGLTPEELKEDLKATRGTKWKPLPDDDGQIDIDAILTYMERPGSEIRRMIAVSGGAGIVDYSLQRKIDDQATIVRRDGKVFLWCQDGIDYGARLAGCKQRQESASKCLEETQSELADAEKAQKDLKNLPSYIAGLEEKKSALVDEMRSLGLFQIKQKRALKSRIGELEANIKTEEERVEAANARVEAARKRVSELKSEIKSLEKAYRSELRKCLRLWDSGKLR